jgi:hypothetical protein
MANLDRELLEKVFYVFAKKITIATWDGELLELLLRKQNTNLQTKVKGNLEKTKLKFANTI